MAGCQDGADARDAQPHRGPAGGADPAAHRPGRDDQAGGDGPVPVPANGRGSLVRTRGSWCCTLPPRGGPRNPGRPARPVPASRRRQAPPPARRPQVTDIRIAHRHGAAANQDASLMFPSASPVPLQPPAMGIRSAAQQQGRTVAVSSPS
jgi:hypothetical protein